MQAAYRKWITVVGVGALWMPFANSATPFSAAKPTPAPVEPTPQLSRSGPPFAPVPDKVIVYSGCAMIDGAGALMRPDIAIITRGERIQTIVAAANVQIPPGAEIIDMKGKFALPGLINSHEHLATTPDRRFAEAMMRRDLYGGVTAVRSMGDDARALADYARQALTLGLAQPPTPYRRKPCP